MSNSDEKATKMARAGVVLTLLGLCCTVVGLAAPWFSGRTNYSPYEITIWGATENGWMTTSFSEMCSSQAYTFSASKCHGQRTIQAFVVLAAILTFSTSILNIINSFLGRCRNDIVALVSAISAGMASIFLFIACVLALGLSKMATSPYADSGQGGGLALGPHAGFICTVIACVVLLVSSGVMGVSWKLHRQCRLPDKDGSENKDLAKTDVQITVSGISPESGQDLDSMSKHGEPSTERC